LIRQGVAGIFLKEQPLSALAETIRKIQAGDIVFDPRYDALAGEARATGLSGSGPKFNERQRKVLRFVLEGLSNKEIAWRLQISESYVKAILQSLFSKTGVRTRGQLVRVALEQYEDQL
jgi:two-component system nitrate/nitrite response regulator NarL